MRFTEPSRRVALDEELCFAQASSGLWPPCRAACPVGTDARGYMEAISFGRYEEAFRIAREPNPVVSACSYICHHPCEEACRRDGVDEPLAIRNLKRWAVENGRPPAEERADELAALRSRAEPTGKKVAIVGSGPAGLAVAEELSLAGHQVTIFERRSTAGGQLANTIPMYRLPREELARDVAEIEALDVEIRTGVEVGEDTTIDELAEEYDAVVLAIGLSSSRALPIDGMDAGAVWLALPFLEACVAYSSGGGEEPVLGDDVIVIGGGNVAVDVARSAMRLGPKSVTMVCLESEEEMPAWEWELEEAAQEGISIRCSLGPKRILVEGDRCAGLETKGVKCVFDEAGRFAPEFHEDQVDAIAGDTVIVAIGQAADYVSVEGSDIEIDGRGRLMFDPARMVTSRSGVFACGEVVTGPGAAIEAAASGKRAAKAVDGYLRTGAFRAVPEEVREEIDPLPERVADVVPGVERQPMSQIAPDVRRKNQEVFEEGYSQAAALAESRRCMLCGAGAVVQAEKCATCVTCERVCPFGVPSVKGVGWAPALTCQACGVCVVECPAGAIDMAAVDAWEVKDAVAAAMLTRPEAKTLALVCSHVIDDWAAPPMGESGPDTVQAWVSCPGRIRVDDVLRGYELGAERVVVARCTDEKAATCRFGDACKRADRRLGRVAELLPQMGLDLEAFEVVSTT